MNKKLKVFFSKKDEHFDNVELTYGDHCFKFIINNSDHYSKVVNFIIGFINLLREKND